MTSDGLPDGGLPPAGDAGGLSPFQRWMHWFLLGPQGIRAGWRLLIFLGISTALSAGLSAALRHIPAIHAWSMAHRLGAGVITPGGLLFTEGLSVVVLLLSAAGMTLVEKRSFAEYGLPGAGAFGKRFWQGAVWGFLMVSLLMGLIGALHGFQIGGWAVGRGEAVRYALLYALGFVLVGVSEEFSFRGYLQATLSQGIGFWPAAGALAILFGAAHLGNPGEAKFGALMAGGFALVAAFSLRRTGNLWFAIGMHAAWDWGETYFYSVPDSGLLATGHLLNSSFHGPAWLTGGSVGPEGSVLVFAVLALWAAILHFLFPARRAAR
ncbi:MAG: CPBP family intramembrane metalloprotease [Acidobacteriia bacterium]|nr:CPBP family intramembrane metalloprotease [Terriglobia bacterium]